MLQAAHGPVPARDTSTVEPSESRTPRVRAVVRHAQRASTPLRSGVVITAVRLETDRELASVNTPTPGAGVAVARGVVVAVGRGVLVGTGAGRGVAVAAGRVGAGALWQWYWPVRSPHEAQLVRQVWQPAESVRPGWASAVEGVRASRARPVVATVAAATRMSSRRRMFDDPRYRARGE